jgi:DNA-binding transcriptional LysR family regulator
VDIELRHLKIVLAIAEAGSVTKAAANLGLAQPALTTQLQRIERALGGTLFERDRLGARPTALGDLVLARARVVLPALHGLQDEASILVGSGPVSRYRVGATNGPVAGGLVQRLTDAHPGRQVSILSTWSVNEIAQKVLAGDLDFALVGACAGDKSSQEGGLVWQPVSVDAVWALISRDHPLAGRSEVALSELSGEQWVTAPGDTCFNECFAAACAREGFSPRAALEMDVGSVMDLVAGGKAVALAQATIREIEGVTAVPIAGAPMGWRHLLGWDRNGPVSQLAGEVFELAVAAYQDIVRQRHRYARWLDGHPELGAQPRA